MTMEPGSIEFLELVRDLVIRLSARSGRPVGVRWLAKRMEAGEEEVEAAMIHLVRRGELRYRKNRRALK